MPHYWFDVFDGYDVVRDREGQSYGSPDVARQEADESVRELLATTVRRHTAIRDQEMRVRDGSGGVIATIRFKDVLDG